MDTRPRTAAGGVVIGYPMTPLRDGDDDEANNGDDEGE